MMKGAIRLAILVIMGVSAFHTPYSLAQTAGDFSFNGFDRFRKIEWSHSGDYLAALGREKDSRDQEKIFIWDMSQQDLIKSITIGSSTGDFAWSYDDQFIIVAGEEISVWWVEDGKKQVSLEDGLISADVLALSPNGKYLASTNYDPVVYIWNTETWQLEMQLQKGSDLNPQGLANPLVWHPFDLKIATYNPEEGLVILDITSESRRVLGLVEPREGLNVSINIEVLAWSPTGDYIIGSGLINSNEMFIWNVSTGEQFWKEVYGYDVAWHPETNLIAKVRTTSGSSGLISIFYSDNFEIIAEIPITYQDQSAGVFDLEWSPDGKFLAAALDDGTVTIWDISQIIDN